MDYTSLLTARDTGMLSEFSRDRLQHYVWMREKIDAEIKLIRSLSTMMGKFEQFEQDKMEIDPVALGTIHQKIEQSILEIWHQLDDFLLVNNAKAALEERNKIKNNTLTSA